MSNNETASVRNLSLINLGALADSIHRTMDDMTKTRDRAFQTTTMAMDTLKKCDGTDVANVITELTNFLHHEARSHTLSAKMLALENTSRLLLKKHSALEKKAAVHTMTDDMVENYIESCDKWRNKCIEWMDAFSRINFDITVASDFP
jgi:hypothetical protein